MNFEIEPLYGTGVIASTEPIPVSTEPSIPHAEASQSVLDYWRYSY